MDRDIKDMIKRSIKREGELELIGENKDKTDPVKIRRFEKYLGYMNDYIDKNIEQDNGKQQKEILNKMINILTDEDKALLIENGMYKDDLLRANSKGSHSVDNRNTLDYLMSIQIGSVMEKMVIIEGQLLGYNLDNNDRATHSQKDWMCYEPDFMLKHKGKNIEIELQTVDKQHDHIICKEGKLNALKKFAKQGRPVYILQQTIVNGECSYAVVNVADKFLKMETAVERNSGKQWMIAEEEAIYKPLNETIEDIDREIERKKEEMKKPLTLEGIINSFGDRAVITNKTKKTRGLETEH